MGVVGTKQVAAMPAGKLIGGMAYFLGQLELQIVAEEKMGVYWPQSNSMRYASWKRTRQK